MLLRIIVVEKVIKIYIITTVYAWSIRSKFYMFYRGNIADQKAK